MKRQLHKLYVFLHEYQFVCVVFLMSLAVHVGIASYIASNQPRQAFLLSELLFEYKPTQFQPFANFDGIHYMQMAERGYVQYEQAYFPLYAICIYLLNIVINNSLLSGFFISNIAFLAGLLFFYRNLIILQLPAKFIIISLLVFPTSFYFHTLYTESLFFLFLNIAIWGLLKRNFFISAAAGFLAGTTRLIGVAIGIMPTIMLYFQRQTNTVKGLIACMLAPFAGLTIYMNYLWFTTGDPIAFFSSQPAFGANRSTDLVLLPQVIYRYIKIFFTADFSHVYMIAILEFGIFLLAFAALIVYYFIFLKKRRSHSDIYWGIGLFSAINLLLPTLTGTLSSVPRYALLCLTTFFVFSYTPKRLQWLLLGLAYLLHWYLFWLFAQGFFVA